MTSQPALRDFMANLVAREGRIDILVNNAGTPRYRAFDAIADTDWDAVIALDRKAVFFCAQAAARSFFRKDAARL